MKKRRREIFITYQETFHFGDTNLLTVPWRGNGGRGKGLYGEHKVISHQSNTYHKIISQIISQNFTINFHNNVI